MKVKKKTVKLINVSGKVDAAVMLKSESNCKALIRSFYVHVNAQYTEPKKLRLRNAGKTFTGFTGFTYIAGKYYSRLIHTCFTQAPQGLIINNYHSWYILVFGLSTCCKGDVCRKNKN